MDFGAEIPKIQKFIFLPISVLAFGFSLALAQCPNDPALTPEAWGGASGGASVNSGTYTLWGDGDFSTIQNYEQGESAHRALVGSGEIQARVSGFSGTKSSDTGIGVYIRRGTLEGSDGAFFWLRGTSGSKVDFGDRTGGGHLAIQTTGSTAIPTYLRIQNWDGMVYPAISANGLSWTVLGQYDLTADLQAGQTLTYGLMVWSGVNGSPTTAVFDHVCAMTLTTPIPTWTPTRTYTSTVSPTPTRTPTPASPTMTPTFTPTHSPTPTPIPTHSFTPTPMVTVLASPTATPLPGHGAWPNPFTPDLPTDHQTVFQLPVSHGAGQVTIVDLHRRPVRALAFGAGSVVAWDGKNEGGSTVPSGVYLYLLETDGTVRRGTLTVLR